MKEKFIAKTFNTYKTVKKAFVDWKDNQSHIESGHFKELMVSWGFANDCTELFNWLDQDGDGKVSFMDLRNSIGDDISPMESFFFRQDIKSSKNVPCQFTNCWENLLYSKSKSPYCELHQKIIRN